MKENKKDILEKIGKVAKKNTKFESKLLNLVLQRLDSDNFEIENNTVYTSDFKRLIYVLGDQKEHNIKEGVEIVGEMAFAKKKGLKKISLPESLKKIERDAFLDCDGLTSIKIPASVEEIEAYAFSDCDSLKTVFFEKVPKVLSRKAFSECDKLNEISVPSDEVKAARKALHYVDGDTDFIVVGRGGLPEPMAERKSKKAKKQKDGDAATLKAESKKTTKNNDTTDEAKVGTLQ